MWLSRKNASTCAEHVPNLTGLPLAAAGCCAIRQIFDCYAKLPFILIGDSGQEDPEIYRDVVHTYRGRVLAVYIRNVTPALARTEAIRKLAEEVREAGSVLLLSDDTLASARHAAQQGWIRQESVALVERAVSSSEARPD